MAILDNYLVNVTGKFGMFSELDLLQEHHNFLIKHLFNEKSYSFDSSHLAESISLNLRGFKILRDLFPGWLGLGENSGSHMDPDKSSDINKLGSVYRRNNLLRFKKSRLESYLVQDEFMVGLGILEDGKIDEFISRTLTDATDVTGTNYGMEVEI